MRPNKESTQRQHRSLAVEFVPRDFFLLMKFEFAVLHFTTATFLLQSPCVFPGAAGCSSAPIYRTGRAWSNPPEPPEARPNTLQRGFFSHSREGANARPLRQCFRRFDRFSGQIEMNLLERSQDGLVPPPGLKQIQAKEDVSRRPVSLSVGRTHKLNLRSAEFEPVEHPDFGRSGPDYLIPSRNFVQRVEKSTVLRIDPGSNGAGWD